MADITHALTAGLTDRGWHVSEIGVDPLSGRLIVTDPTTLASVSADR